MLEENELAECVRRNLEPADFQDERACRIVSILFDLMEQGKSIEPVTLMNQLGDEFADQVICESMFLPESLSQEQKETVAMDCVRRLKNERLKFKRKCLHDQIKAAQQTGDEESLGRLIGEFDCLIKQRTEP